MNSLLFQVVAEESMNSCLSLFALWRCILLAHGTHTYSRNRTILYLLNYRPWNSHREKNKLLICDEGENRQHGHWLGKIECAYSNCVEMIIYVELNKAPLTHFRRWQFKKFLIFTVMYAVVCPRSHRGETGGNQDWNKNQYPPCLKWNWKFRGAADIYPVSSLAKSFAEQLHLAGPAEWKQIQQGSYLRRKLVPPSCHKSNHIHSFTFKFI